MTTSELRPMSIGELLDKTFTLYRQNFLVFMGIMAVPQLFVLLLGVVGDAFQVMAPAATAPGAGGPGAATTFLLTSALFSLVTLFVYFAMYAVAQAATVFAVADLYTGKPITVRDAYRRVRGKFRRITDVLISSGLRVGLGFILLVIPGILLMLRYSVAVPVAMLEDLKAGAALKRSTTLTEGRRGEAFLIFLLSAVLGWVATLIFTMPFAFLQAFLARSGGASPLLHTLTQFGSFVGGVLVGPIATIAFALFYYDCRIRKEALDLQVMLAALEQPGATPATP